MAIEFPNLPFAMDALEPQMSRRTLEFHYGKHHKSYVDKLNKLIAGTRYEGKNLEDILLATHGKEEKIYNNAAQAWNHAFFWQCLKKEPGSPSADLKRAFEENFGDLEGFRAKFNEVGKALFGSGWVWLTQDGDGKLQIRPMKNAENPLIDDETPLLVCDVWEHAYYLDYQNERPKFLENFWQIVNWAFVGNNLAKASREVSTGSRTGKISEKELRP
jgi:Fe-Mn family superoxide dismutase